MNKIATRCLSQALQEPVQKPEHKVKCTLIPGDGVGPELCAATRELLNAVEAPVEFEELFLRFVALKNLCHLYLLLLTLSHCLSE